MKIKKHPECDTCTGYKKGMTCNHSWKKYQDVGIDGNLPEIINCDKLFVGAKIEKHPECETCQGYQINMDCVGTWRYETDEGRRFAGNCPMRQKAIEEAKFIKLQSDTMLSPRFLQRRFGTFEPSKHNQEAYDFCSAWNIYQTETALLYGKTGTGKTHLMAAMVLNLIENGIVTIFQNTPDMFNKIKATFNDPKGNADQAIETLANVPVLFLDDLGAGRKTLTDWETEVLYRIVNTRYEALKPIHISTNLQPADLATVVGMRIYSRLREMCRFIEVGGTDRRLAPK